MDESFPSCDICLQRGIHAISSDDCSQSGATTEGRPYMPLAKRNRNPLSVISQHFVLELAALAYTDVDLRDALAARISQLNGFELEFFGVRLACVRHSFPLDRVYLCLNPLSTEWGEDQLSARPDGE